MDEIKDLINNVIAPELNIEPSTDLAITIYKIARKLIRDEKVLDIIRKAYDGIELSKEDKILLDAWYGEEHTITK